ncbi:hypothetical protein Csa_011048 [Cucumis sativus]|uniref:Uncharacterized protein n=1 Tax=Cucumis sativus TaxID=3659 RepID=A0A0A0L7B0_CUCSA|nr:hypothetical protein Csa_011048 [Cucumis sativus]
MARKSSSCTSNGKGEICSCKGHVARNDKRTSQWRAFHERMRDCVDDLHFSGEKLPINVGRPDGGGVLGGGHGGGTVMVDWDRTGEERGERREHC